MEMSRAGAQTTQHMHVKHACTCNALQHVVPTLKFQIWMNQFYVITTPTYRVLQSIYL